MGGNSWQCVRTGSGAAPAALNLWAACAVPTPAAPCRTQLDKINADIVKDPTLQRDLTAACERCVERDPSPDAPRFGAVFYQAPASFSSAEKMYVRARPLFPCGRASMIQCSCTHCGDGGRGALASSNV